MYPYLIDWVVDGQHFKVPSYGVMLAIAFSAAYFSALRRAIILEEEPRHIENLFLIIVLGSVLGARLFHVLFEEPGHYFQHPGKILALWEGGYTLYGAMLTCIGLVYWYCRGKNIPYLEFIDIASEATALGIFFGRFGCFLAGCCWGTESHLPWAVIFSHPESFADVKTVPVHPTQLYESFGAFAIYLYCLWRFSKRKYLGQIFFHSLAMYAVLRFCVEIIRGDEYRGYVFGGSLSYSQLVSLTVLPFVLVGMFLYSRLKKT